MVNYKDLVASLSDSKKDFETKIDTLKLLQKVDTGTNSSKDQFILDWITGTLEYVSKTAVFVSSNAKQINTLVLHLEEEFFKNIQCPKKCFLKSNFLEVFAKLFQYPAVIDQMKLLRCWYLVLQEDSWCYSLHKSNLLIEVLSNSCMQHVTIKDTELSKKNLFVILALSKVYLKHINAQFNIKKIFKQFCTKLVVPLIMVYSICLNSLQDDNSIEELTNLLDMIMKNIFTEKEHMGNLKLFLSSMNLENKQIVGKKQKMDFYFQGLFDQFKDCKENMAILTAVPMLMENIIISARKTGNMLSHYEEFQLFKYLVDVFQLKALLNEKDLKTQSLSTLKNMLIVVNKYDLYQSVEDKNNGDIFVNWMIDLYNSLKKMYSLSTVAEQDIILQIILYILKINHLVLENDLKFIWSVCLSKKENPSVCLENRKEELLCEMLECYDKLHQVKKFLEHLWIEPENTAVIPFRFINKLSTVISNLQIKHINSLLLLFQEKCNQCLSQLSDDNVSRLEHWSILSCYVVLFNASIIPENGYMKPDLQNTIEIVKQLKQLIETLKSETKFQDRLLCISYLLQHAINHFCLFLKEFALDDGITDQFVNTIITHNTPSQKYTLLYIKICFCFDEIRFGKEISKALTTLHGLVKELNSHYTKTKNTSVLNNSQYLNISADSLLMVVIEEFERNLLLLLCYDDKHDLIDWFIKTTWLDSSSHQSVFQSLDNYNKISFQESLLLAMNDSLEKIIQSDTKFNMKVFLEDIRKDSEIKKSTIELQLEQWKSNCHPISSKESNNFKSFLEKIECLPLEYFVSDTLLTICMLIIRIQLCISHTEICLHEHCFKLLQIISENMILTSTKSSYIPFSHIFKEFLKFYMKNDKVECNKEESQLVLRSLIKALIHDGDISNVPDMFKDYLNNTSTKVLLLQLCNEAFIAINHVLSNSILKSRSEQATFNFMLALFDPIIQYMNEESCLCVSLFTQLSTIVHQAFLKGKKKLNKTLTSKISKQARVDSTVQKKLIETASSMKSLIETSLSCDQGNTKQLLQLVKLLTLVYEQPSSEFTLQLKTTFHFTDEYLIINLLKIFDNTTLKEGDEEIISTLCINIVLSSQLEHLSNLLGLLTDNLVACLTNGYKSSCFLLWKKLLCNKWSKEQRIVLWNILPKVVLCNVHMLQNVDDIYQIQNIIQVLINAINLAKNSLMSNYMTCIYHAFTIVSTKITNATKLNGFVCLYHDMFTLASQLLFNHQSAVYTSLPSFIQCVNSLLHLLEFACQRSTTSTEITTQDISNCCENLARLYREIGSHKTIICKYSPYIISEYVRVCQQVVLSATDKNVLDSGMYCILDTCTEYEISLLTTILEKGDKEHYRILRTKYEKHYKYEGKA